ncbi:MAG TPA: hypothetical protein PKZ16_02775 [bacterium]|nr:hypothetical protein [bacterium]HPL95240.1 hypothetical protein [bacterium]
MLKKIFFLSLLFLISTFLPLPTLAAVNLVKTANSSAVYFVDVNNTRHIFPNKITYESWFGNDFSKVATVSEKFMASLPLGKNITLKPGKYLVKVSSLSEVYAVEPGGTLRHIESEETADKIYGPNWQKKIINLPEVFFNDYVKGQPIEYEYQIPDGVVYKLVGQPDYYYKTKGHVRKFASFVDVLANGYAQTDVVEHLTTFYVHGKEIKGYDATINNLSAENNLTNYDCENKNLKAAFIFVYDQNYTNEELAKIKNIKTEFPFYFSWATDNLSNFNLASDIFLINKQSYHLFQNKLSLSQVAFDFYDFNLDVYDFLFIFDNFSPESKIIAEHHLVTNQINGIQKPIFTAEVQYGSLGKLKGVINMFNINSHSFNSASEKNITLNNILHELLHQWSGTFVFFNDKNKTDASLYDEKSKHWSNYVNFVSPLGGYGWVDNGNGTFTQSYVDQRIKLSNLDLYGMGLMPLRGIGELFYLIPDNSLITNTISGKKVIVDPVSLKNAMGHWQCLK